MAVGGLLCWTALVLSFRAAGASGAEIGKEVAVERHLEDGEEFTLPIGKLLSHGKLLFNAHWTQQEGGGRPLTKGTGKPLVDSAEPLVFPRNFNRISGPDANSCAGCHNAPFGLAGGGGDYVTNVFVLGQRFDFATFDAKGPATKSSLDESGKAATLQQIANSRSTLGMFGSGYIEMLARQMTQDLQALRAALSPDAQVALTTKGVSFGTLKRDAAGNWDTALVTGLPSTSLTTTGPTNPPSLIIRPFHQAGAVVSLREFTVNAFNHHHGIQAIERFEADKDPDGDGISNEMTRADVTAATLFQATLAVPGQVLPKDPEIKAAIQRGEDHFQTIGCTRCHLPFLPLDPEGLLFTEPNPFNPAGTLQESDTSPLTIRLDDPRLPQPRLRPDADGIVRVRAFTDLKLHDITSGPSDPNREPLNMHAPAGSGAFFAGNSRFLTKKLWGAANEPPYFHHGQFTTLREAILAHAGESSEETAAFKRLTEDAQGDLVEFLKSLQILPPGTRQLVIHDKGKTSRARSGAH